MVVQVSGVTDQGPQAFLWACGGGVGGGGLCLEGETLSACWSVLPVTRTPRQASLLESCGDRTKSLIPFLLEKKITCWECLSKWEQGDGGSRHRLKRQDSQ